MAGTLGQWYVEIVSKGQEKVLTDVDEVRVRMDKADKDNARQMRHQQQRILQIRHSWLQLGNVIKAQNIIMGTALYGLARAGLSGTTQGAALSVRFQQLSRELAALFLPQINAAITGMGRLVQKFQELDGRGQDFVASMIGVAAAIKLAFSGHPILAAATGMAALVMNTKEGKDLFRSLADLGAELAKAVGPTLKAAVEDVTAAVRTMVGVLTDAVRTANELAQSLAGVSNLSNRVVALGRAATPLTGLSDIVQFFRGNRSPLQERFNTIFGSGQTVREERLQGRRERRDVFPAGGAFEQFGDTFRRVQSAVVQQDIPSQQLRELQRIRELLTQIVLNPATPTGSMTGQLMGGARDALSQAHAIAMAAIGN